MITNSTDLISSDQYLNYGHRILEYGHEHTNTNANMISDHIAI